MLVELCMNNEGHEEIEKLIKEKSPETEVEIQGCLGYCHVCATGRSFAFVNGDPMEADSAEELVEEILSK
ncbi:DUF1450 domain-containing protein [Clostridium hydrogeniformans]|uniref:DUF1450 domain-containing protein n=1 Tax=Clostridium hydrogeniformans TaxID=349933 RepID=UPI0004836BAF|nr:DUF1450 domain-containing protein [Clostridium hydrogeniformans]